MAVSIPFTLGIAIGTASLPLLPGRPFTALPASLLLAACGVLAGVVIVKGGSRWRTAALFLALGCFCALSWNLAGGLDSGRVPRLKALALRCAESLKALIGSIPFRDEGTGALLRALLTGDRSALGRDAVEAFRGSGASHILALSGLHLGVICLMVGRGLAVLGNSPPAKAVRAVLTVIFAGFYAMMTGAGPSIVRAFIFIVITQACSLMPERRYSPLRTLLISLTLQLAFCPAVISELGFQLSYLAMTGIFVLYPRLESWYPEGRRDPLRKIWQSTALSVSCQVFTAPLVWLRFRTFPKYFIVTNLLALPLTTALMTASVVMLVLSALSLCPVFLVRVTEWLAEVLVSVMEVISSL